MFSTPQRSNSFERAHRDRRNSQVRTKETSCCVPRSWLLHRPHENGVEGPRGSGSCLGAPVQLGSRYHTIQNAHSYPSNLYTQFWATQSNGFGSKTGTKEVASMLSAPRVMLPHLQQQQPQQGQQGQPGQQQQHAIPPPPPPVQVTNPQDLSLAGVLHFLQTEWRRYERERNEWEIERAEMRVCLQKQPDYSSNHSPFRRELPSSRASDAPSKM
jgi:hypothetical protein